MTTYAYEHLHANGNGQLLENNCTFFFFIQFLVYFFYFTLLTVIYLACAAWVIIRHYRNQSGGEGGTTDQATPTELSPVVVNPSETEPLSNGNNIKV